MAETGDRRNGLGLGILVVLGVLIGTSGSLAPSGKSGGEGISKSSRVAPPTEPGSGKDKDGAGDYYYCKPYIDFRDIHRASEIPESEQALDLGQLLARDVSRMAPEFLIVSVPEPVESRFGYRFDAILDAVQMAIESQGWNLERFWLPWLPSGRQFSDRSELKPVRDPDGKAFLHEEKPGVLLFRKPTGRGELDQRQKVMVVLLVGETPTSGVAKAALAECFTIIKSYHQSLQDKLDRLADVMGPARVFLGVLPGPGGSLVRCFDPTGTSLRNLLAASFRRVDVRIVGPIFSGSEQSLTLAIYQCLEEKRGDSGWSWNIFVRTGSADRIDREKFELDAGHGRWPNVTVRFDATVIPIEALMMALFDFLKSLNGGTPLGKVALLTESDTAFGKPFGTDTIAKWIGPDRGTTVTTMKFPFHISQVAVALNQSDRKDDSRAPTLIRPSSRLSIPFDETGEPRDVVPSLSPAMSTATNSFVLAKILETISMEDFRYIGILATDTRDTIFLAGLIQQYCPDVQLFTPVGDLLLGHPRYANELRGMIVATPYPLFSMAQRWDPPYEGDHRRHLFSHQGDQGTYNATLSLLFRTSRSAQDSDNQFYEALFDYGLPFDELEDLSVFWRGKDGGPTAWRARYPSPPNPGKAWRLRLNRPSEQPAIWFSVIGQRGLWPVAYLDVGDREMNGGYTFNARYSKKLDADQFAGQFPALVPQFSWQWGTVFLSMSGVAWLLVVLHARLVSASRDGHRTALAGMEALLPLDMTRAWPDPTRAWRTRDRAQRELFVVIGLSLFLVVYAYVALYPCWVVFRYSPAAVFLDLPRSLVVSSELWHAVPRNDQHNLRFAWLALYSGHITFLALLGAVLLRVGLWWNPALKVERKSLILVMVGVASVCLLLALSVTQLFQWRWKYVTVQGQLHRLLFFERAVNFGSGVSPLVPALMLALVCGLWIYYQSRRLYLAERFWGPPRSPATPDWLARFGRLILEGAGWPFALAGSFLGKAAGRLRAWRDSHLDVAGRPRAGFDSLIQGAGWLRSRCDSLHDFLRDQAGSLMVERRAAAPSGPGRDLPAVIPTGAAVAAGRGNARLPASAASSKYDPETDRARERFRRIGVGVDRVEQLVQNWLPRRLLLQPPVLAAVGLGGVALFRLLQRSLPGVDFPGGWTTLVMSAIWFLALTIVVALNRFVFLWLAISATLSELLRWPMSRAYERIPAQFSRSFGRYLDQIRPSVTILTIPVQQWALVAKNFHEVADELGHRWLKTSADSGKTGVPALEQATFVRAAKAITTGNPASDGPPPEGLEAAGAIHKGFSNDLIDAAGKDELAASATWFGLRNAARACIDLLEPSWESTPPADGFGELPGDGATNPEAHQNASSEALRQWMRAAEDLIALEVVVFVSQCTIHLKNMTYYLAVAPILLILAVSSYPFQPQRFLQVCLWAILLAVVASVVSVYIRMEHNEILSRVSKTAPNRVEFDRTFVTTILTFIVPLVGIVLTQFPYVSDTLNQLFAPIAGVLK